MEQSILYQILEAGTRAPSGDNAQPWEFEIDDDRVHLFNNHRLDHPHFNFRQRGTYLAHGALIENVVHAANHFGFKTSIHLFPDSTNPNHTATIAFSPGEKTSDTLYPFIAQRVTNRKPYKHKPLTDLQRTELAGTPGCVILEDPQKIKSLGPALSITELVALENEAFHRFFFDRILWSAQEQQQQCAGLYIKTMELPPPIQGIFRLIRHWPINRVFNVLGFSKLAAKANARLYTSASALALFVLPQDDDQAFVECGRVVERFWLTLTKLGLYAQPITGMLYLSMRIQEGETGTMQQNHLKRIMYAHQEIASTFGVKKGTFPMLLRIGFAHPPSAQSQRFPVASLIRP